MDSTDRSIENDLRGFRSIPGASAVIFTPWRSDGELSGLESVGGKSRRQGGDSRDDPGITIFPGPVHHDFS